jgi:hypothetical protein
MNSPGQFRCSHWLWQVASRVTVVAIAHRNNGYGLHRRLALGQTDWGGDGNIPAWRLASLRAQSAVKLWGLCPNSRVSKNGTVPFAGESQSPAGLRTTSP